MHNSAPHPPCTKCGDDTTHVFLPSPPSSPEPRSTRPSTPPPPSPGPPPPPDLPRLNEQLLRVSDGLLLRASRHLIAPTPQGRILLALFRKAVNTFRAMQLLKGEHLIEESWVLLRVLLENHIDILYLLENDTTALTQRWADASILDKLKYLREVDFYDGTTLQNMVNRQEWKNLETEIRSRYSEKDFRALRKHGYSGISVQQRAEHVGMANHYQNLYRIASRSVHKFDPSETQLMDYLQHTDAADDLLASRRTALESAQNELLARLSIVFSQLTTDLVTQAELCSLGFNGSAPPGQ